MQDIASLIEDEILKAFAPREILAGADRHVGAGHQPFPGLRILHRKRIFQPQRFDRFHCLGDLDRSAQIVLPMAVDHNVVVPANGFATVLESLAQLDEFPGGELLVAGVAAVVGLRIRPRETEFVRGEPARIGVDLLCPLAAGRFIQHIARSFMIVDADPVTEFSSQQRAGGHGEDLARKIPQGHLDAAGGAEEVVRGAIRAGAGKVFRADTQVCVQGIDLQRIFPQQPRFDG